ncbi:hypothetical protein JCM6882_003050 [Rhodosporidiobolus microsporus]
MPLLILRNLRMGGDRPHVLESVSPSDTIASVHAQARAALMDNFSDIRTILVSGETMLEDENATLEQCNIDCGEDSEASLLLIASPY